MPPSPLLSARRMNTTYLRLTTIMSDQNTMESTPITLAGVASTACMPWKHSLIV